MGKHYFVHRQLIITFLVLIFAGYLHSQNSILLQDVKQKDFRPSEINSGSEAEDPDGGPDLEKRYFDIWNQPYGHLLPSSVLQVMLRQTASMPDESSVRATPNLKMNKTVVSSGWRLLGPSGMRVTYDSTEATYYSGRILDIEPSSDGSIVRVAAASGGLWQLNSSDNTVAPLSDGVNSLAIGSFATNPDDPNTIFVGTGEPSNRTGTGLWKTADGGKTWSNVSSISVPDGFYKIRFQKGNPNKINAASTSGYYYSYDNGNNFNVSLSGNVTDFAVAPNDTSIIYACMQDSGVYKSTNSGLTWTPITSVNLPSSDMGRMAVTAYNSRIVYIAISNSSDYKMKGIYKTADGGDTWQNVSPQNNYLSNQGWYDNIISVCPVDSNLIIAGGVDLIGSTDGGQTWQTSNSIGVHADHHAIAWSADGNTIWEGNDGGLTISKDRGSSWSTASNHFPITQYVDINAGKNNPGVIFGGSQDNGLSGTTNGGSTWNHTSGGDGGGMAVDPLNASNIFASVGVYSDGWNFHFQASSDMGQNWQDLNNGIDSSDQWFTKIRINNTGTQLFASSGYYIYSRTQTDAAWVKVNPAPFGNLKFTNVTVTPTSPNSTPILYACTDDPTNGNVLKVYDNGNWYEASTGFPANFTVRKVVPDPSDYNTAYALINGFSPQKIFKTTDRGKNWRDVTGNLPNVPMGDLVVNPSDTSKLYAGTELGCYKSNDGGQTWFRWNNGMPDASIVTEMSYIDSSSINGKFYVIAGTYGRSMYLRDASADDVTGLANRKTMPVKFELDQNYPNPFNPSTIIHYSIPKSELVSLKIYNLLGQEITALVNKVQTAGGHEISFNAAGLSSGVYFYRLDAGNNIEIKKMILMK